MTSTRSFRIPSIQEPKEGEINTYRWQRDLVRAINMLVDSVNSLGSYIS